jgi:Homeodomain-like domain-containing protein
VFDCSVRGGRNDCAVDRDSLKLFLDQCRSLEEIGRRMDRHPSTVGYWVQKHGLQAAHSARHSARGGIPHEILVELVEAGGTHRSIAEDLGVSVATVKHWLKRFGLETHQTALRRQSREGRRTGVRKLERVCRQHGPGTFVLGHGGTYRCVRCHRDAVARRRRAIRAKVIQEAGGRCVVCGYSSYVGALQFHHLDPSQKEFGLSSRGFTRSLERVRDEAKKCVLLCANCHAEVEGGVRELALEFASR